MSFKENLLKKIFIDKLAVQVLSSIGPLESGKRIDRQAMKTLLSMGPYSRHEERDLEMYILEASGDEKQLILVLDNDLPVYRTTVQDVALRKSPTVKEMISIKNAIKILNDKDVLVSKKQESVKTIQSQIVGRMDLSYSREDIEEIENDGVASLRREDVEGVIEAMALFEELLGYQRPPKVFQIANHEMIGPVSKKPDGELIFGPAVIYGIIQNELKLCGGIISNLAKDKIELLHKVAVGKEKADMEGAAVFSHLRELVLQKQPPWKPGY
jgi:hypothetical protein